MTNSTTTDLTSEIIKVGNLDIHYHTGGKGDPLIIVHGGGNDSSVWINNARDLSKYYRVYLPDLPGFGNSTSMGDKFNLGEFAGFLDDFSKSLGVKEFHLLGHSIGGCIALYYASLNPQNIKKLVLVSSLCLGKEIALWVRFLSRGFFRHLLGEPALAFIKVARWIKDISHAPFEVVSFVSRLRMNIGKSTTAFRGQTLILQNLLSGLMVPTLLVWGAKDPIVPVKQAHNAARLIPDGQVHVYEGRGHSPYHQNTTEFAELLNSFLG